MMKKIWIKIMSLGLALSMIFGATGVSYAGSWNVKDLDVAGMLQAGLKVIEVTADIEEGLIKETAINKSYMAFVLADHSKFRRVYSVTFAPLQKCCIITDKLPTPDFSQATVIKEVKNDLHRNA